MAKANNWPLMPGAVPRSVGRLNTIVTKNGVYYQKWPKKRGAATSGGALYQQLEFALAASWAANPEPIGLQTAIELAKGTDLVPRDYIMRTIYGTYYDVYLPDGTKAVSYRMVAPNAQLILDQVTDEVGAILFRDEIGWIGLAPGNAGYVLTMQNGKPLWLPSSGGGGGGATITWFTAPGPDTYTIPASAQLLAIYATGGGGGGGTGRRTASGVAASGGGGGAGGNLLWTTLNRALLGSTLTLNIGAAGTGASPILTDNTNGAAGGAGGTTTISNGTWTLTAAGGGGGGAGSTGTTGPTNAAGAGRSLGGSSGGCLAGQNGLQAAVNSNFGPTGGGGGAGMPAAPAARNGGASGSWATSTGYPIITAAGGVGSPAAPPQAGLALGLDAVVGGGGGGGAVTAAGIASAGAAGSLYGGGGGGGAASLNGNPTGAGGAGAPGAILIIAW